MDIRLPIISVTALICAVAALILSIVSTVRLARQEKDRRDMRTLQLIREMRSRCQALLGEYRDHPDDPQIRKSYLEAAGDLADGYEEVCRSYYEEKTEPRWFCGLYGREIVAWVEQGPLRQAFLKRRPAYPATARAYREMRTSLTHIDPAMERFFAPVHLNKEQKK